MGGGAGYKRRWRTNGLWEPWEASSRKVGGGSGGGLGSSWQLCLWSSRCCDARASSETKTVSRCSVMRYMQIIKVVSP